MFENTNLFSRLIWFSDLLILNLKCVRSLSANSNRTEREVSDEKREMMLLKNQVAGEQDMRGITQCGAHDS